MSKRQEAALETRRKLVEAGEQLISQHGFEHISVEDITNACGCSKGTFYTYFKKKEDIVDEINRRPFDQTIERLLKEDSGIVEKLMQYFNEFMDNVQYKGLRIAQQWMKNVADPSAFPDGGVNEKLAFDYCGLKELLDQAVEQGELRQDTPVDALSWLLITELYGMTFCWCMSDGAFEPGDWKDQLSKLQIKQVLSDYIGG
ncbi:MAG: TetR/AcrR family transcriptional regulator [Lachnospiraceae bacterium]|nr:TetR/AcrR family transcriptional regulator [Lachnospiraceae bacterium]